jgi:hypothetical protein
MRPATSFLLMALVFGPGCGDDNSGSTSDAAPGGVADASCSPAGIVYLNRAGGDYIAGAQGSDNAFTNTTQVLSESMTLPPTARTDWDEVASCIREALSPFNISVVESDPGDVDHAEVVFTTTSFGGGAISVGPLLCPATERPIAFVFDVQASASETCKNALSQWATAVVSLDHSYACEDYLTFLPSCGPRTWVDDDIECGEFEARDCVCGGTTQNSYQTLLSAFGPTCAE